MVAKSLQFVMVLRRFDWVPLIVNLFDFPLHRLLLRFHELHRRLLLLLLNGKFRVNRRRGFDGCVGRSGLRDTKRATKDTIYTSEEPDPE